LREDDDAVFLPAPFNVIDSKLLTAEDPVEFDIEGIMQVAINDAAGMTFERRCGRFCARIGYNNGR